MKLNNKGLTLIELLVSIALVSIVMGFMFKLLSDAQDARTNNNFAIENQINRNEIIKTIQNDLTSYKIKDITNEGNNIITFSYEDELIPQNEKDFNLTVSSDSISYQTMEKNKDNQLEKVNKKWTMKDSTLGNIIFSNENNIINIRIPVYTTNDNNSVEKNNLMDDIVVDYVFTNNKTNDDSIVYTYWNDDYNTNLYTIGQFPDGKTYDSISALANKDSEFLRKRVFIRSTESEHQACLWYNNQDFCISKGYWDTDSNTTLNNLSRDMKNDLKEEGDCNIYGNHAYCKYGDYFECDANNDGSVVCKSNYITKNCTVKNDGSAYCN